MNLEQFLHQFREVRSREKVTVKCWNDGCPNQETLNKDSALHNIRTHGLFLCRSCSYTEEGRNKIAEAASYKRSDETKTKMSAGKKAFYQTSRGKEVRKQLSTVAAKQHANTNIETTRRRGLFPSRKNKDFRVYGSSYELRAMVLLEADRTVKSYRSQVHFETEKNSRCIDLVIEYRSGRTLIVEIKAHKRTGEQAMIDQIADSRQYAKEHGYEFAVWTEGELGFKSPHEATKWADQYLSKMTSIDYVAIRRQRNTERARKHYHSALSDRIEVYCDFCKENHEIREIQYLDNIEANGRYICIVENGRIQGSRPKDHLKNPYEAEGKKKCSGECGLVLPLEEFSISNKKTGTRCSQCRKCRAKKAKQDYQSKK